MAIYMPKVKTSLDEFRIFMEKTELKMRSQGNHEQPHPQNAIDPTEL